MFCQRFDSLILMPQFTNRKKEENKLYILVTKIFKKKTKVAVRLGIMFSLNICYKHKRPFLDRNSIKY